MFWKRIKAKLQSLVKDAVDVDNYISNYGKDDYDIDVTMAKHNYEVYQNDLKQRSKDLIKKWNKKIIESSNEGKKFFMTNQFVTDEDKDRIRYILSESNCCVDFPLDVTLTHFQHYYESKGFKVVRIEYPTNNICCLKIIWVSSDNKKNEQKTNIEEKKEEVVKYGYWEQGDIYDIGDICSLCGYDSFLEPCDLSHCPSCHAEMKTR